MNRCFNPGTEGLDIVVKDWIEFHHTSTRYVDSLIWHENERKEMKIRKHTERGHTGSDLVKSCMNQISKQIEKENVVELEKLTPLGA
jgi:hypothetical protein